MFKLKKEVVIDFKNVTKNEITQKILFDQLPSLKWRAMNERIIKHTWTKRIHINDFYLTGSHTSNSLKDSIDCGAVILDEDDILAGNGIHLIKELMKATIKKLEGYINLVNEVEEIDKEAASYLKHDAMLLPFFEFKNSLIKCFPWHSTPQKYPYWEKIVNKMKAWKFESGDLPKPESDEFQPNKKQLHDSFDNPLAALRGILPDVYGGREHQQYMKNQKERKNKSIPELKDIMRELGPELTYSSRKEEK